MAIKTAKAVARVLYIKSRIIGFFVARPGYFAWLAGILPALLIGYFGWSYFHAPLWERNGLILKSVKELQAENRKGHIVEAQEVSFRAEFARVVGLFEKSLEFVPKENEVSTILALVQVAADNTGVQVTGLSGVKASIKSPNANKLYENSVPVQVVGDYEKVLEFFDELAAFKRVLMVRDYKVTAVGKGQSARPSKVGVSFSLLAFHAPPSKEFPVPPPDVKANPVSFEAKKRN